MLAGSSASIAAAIVKTTDGETKAHLEGARDQIAKILDPKFAPAGGNAPPLIILGGTALAVMVDAGKAGVANPGAHGFSEILYAFTSAANNNGSSFGGLTASTVFYNVATALAMFIGRFWPIMAALAIAGSLAAKKIVPPSAGTFPTDSGVFVGLLIGVIVIMGGLIYFPALALGPIVEHLAMTAGSLY